MALVTDVSLANMLSPSVACLSNPLNIIFGRTEVFTANDVQLTNYFFQDCALGVLSKKNHSYTQGLLEFLLHYHLRRVLHQLCILQSDL